MMIIASYCDDSCIYFIYKYFKYISGSVFVNRLHLFNPDPQTALTYSFKNGHIRVFTELCLFRPEDIHFREEVFMTIGDKIIIQRKKKGLTQQALADLCGISKRTVASYETDGRIPHNATLRKIASALGCTCTYLTDDTVSEPDVLSDEQFYIDGLREVYGDTTAEEIEELISKSVSLFAGGTIDQDAKDRYFLALTNAYIACKKGSDRS